LCEAMARRSCGGTWVAAGIGRFSPQVTGRRAERSSVDMDVGRRSPGLSGADQ
jgi:hypothetical protein